MFHRCASDLKTPAGHVLRSYTTKWTDGSRHVSASGAVSCWGSNITDTVFGTFYADHSEAQAADDVQVLGFDNLTEAGGLVRVRLDQVVLPIATPAPVAAANPTVHGQGGAWW